MFTRKTNNTLIGSNKLMDDSSDNEAQRQQDTLEYEEEYTMIRTKKIKYLESEAIAIYF